MKAAGKVRRSVPALLLLGAALLLGGCGPRDGAGATATGVGEASAGDDAGALVARIDAIEAAVTRWRSAAGLDAVRAAAEEARNLVVGPAGPSYGDADGDGVIAGQAATGLLPGLHGEPGLAGPGSGACVVHDVLGGDWSDPAARWDTLAEAIAAWLPSNNTFPALPSHPQRIVGWATLALQADDLATALEYGGHAQLHADISLRAVTACTD